MKRLMKILPLMIAVLCIMSWGWLNQTVKAQTNSEENIAAVKDSTEIDKTDTTEEEPDVVAYYFHTTRRCYSCKKIEAYSREAIESGFPEELKNGKLEFHSINIDKAENKHFVKDYQLYTKSLIICDIENGKQIDWKNLSKVWQLLKNKDEFLKYVQDEINAYLKES